MAGLWKGAEKVSLSQVLSKELTLASTPVALCSIINIISTLVRFNGAKCLTPKNAKFKPQLLFFFGSVPSGAELTSQLSGILTWSLFPNSRLKRMHLPQLQYNNRSKKTEHFYFNGAFHPTALNTLQLKLRSSPSSSSIEYSSGIWNWNCTRREMFCFNLSCQYRSQSDSVSIVERGRGNGKWDSRRPGWDWQMCVVGKLSGRVNRKWNLS